MRKSLLVILVVVAVLGVVFVSYGQANNQNSNINTTGPQNTVSVVSNNITATSNNTGTKISPEEAKKIAASYIETTGAKAGTPKLVKQNGKLLYIVPVLINGKTAGEIDIDAYTGQNLGGAGGAP